MLNKHSQASLNQSGLALLYDAVMSTGERLRQLRKKNGLTGEQLAEYMGVSKSMVSQWENDEGVPSTERLLLLRQHIIFSVDWLLFEEPVYSTSDPKLISIMHALEPRAEYVKDAAVKAVLTNCELADQAKENGETGTHG